MMRPCDVCGRPKWDGGHAINERECVTTGDEACQLGVARLHVASLTRERDAYKKAKQENDERFMAERDAARADNEMLRVAVKTLEDVGEKALAENRQLEVEALWLTAKNERLEALFQQTNGMRCHSSWVAWAQRLKGALERIRDDFGDVWGGSKVVGQFPNALHMMICVCCDAEANEYYNIVHDEDCPVFIATAALGTASPGPCSTPELTKKAGELASTPTPTPKFGGLLFDEGPRRKASKCTTCKGLGYTRVDLLPKVRGGGSELVPTACRACGGTGRSAVKGTTP